MDEMILALALRNKGGGGGGGTCNYNSLNNKPQINGVTLSGDKTAQELGLVPENAFTPFVGSIGSTFFNPNVAYSKGEYIWYSANPAVNPPVFYRFIKDHAAGAWQASDVTIAHLMDDIPEIASGGGSSNYNDLSNRPKINNVTLEGNKVPHQFGMADTNDISYIHSMIADEFDENTAYHPNDLVLHDDELYRIIAEHASGVTWDNTEATETSVAELIEEASNYSNLSNKPQINGVTLSENKSASDLYLATSAALYNLDLSTRDGFEMFADDERYSAGDVVWYDGGYEGGERYLYKFDVDHERGPWSYADVTEVSIADLIADASGGLSSDIIAPEFSSSIPYISGALVWYNDTLYRFTAVHMPGAWTGNDVEVVPISKVILDINNSIAQSFVPMVTYPKDTIVIYGSKAYQFTERHTPGPWIGSDATEVNLGDIIRSKADKTAVDNSIAYLNTDIYNLRVNYIPEIIGEAEGVFSTSTAYSAGDIVWHDPEGGNWSTLWRFTANHAAGPWTGNDVEAIDVLSLIASGVAEPLTTAEVNTLIGLLD